MKPVRITSYNVCYTKLLRSVPLAPAGAWLAHYLPRPLLRRGFAVLLVLIGLKMIYAASSGRGP